MLHLLMIGASILSINALDVSTVDIVSQPITVELSRLPRPYATISARKSPRGIAIPTNPRLAVPAGFRVQVFATNLDRPRWLCLTPSGDVLVTETRRNQIRLLRDGDGDGVAEHKSVFANSANGLNIPFGMTFVNSTFILANSHEVRAYRMSSDNRIVGLGRQLTQLPGGGYNQHWTRNVIRSATGDKLYVSIGSATNVAAEALPRASIQVMNVDGTNRQTYAHGLRNPVGLATHPITGELYTTVNERDGLGDDLVPDYFTRVRKDEYFGWPYVYLSANNTDPRHVFANNSLAQLTRTPDVLFQAHSAALGLQFYNHFAFPTKYQNGAFVAFRGSWNRQSGTGYKIVFVPFNRATHRPLGYYEDFLTGFLTDPTGPTTWGRPVGVLVMPDGSLLFTEEMNGRVYRVSYDRMTK